MAPAHDDLAISTIRKCAPCGPAWSDRGAGVLPPTIMAPSRTPSFTSLASNSPAHSKRCTYSVVAQHSTGTCIQRGPCTRAHHGRKAGATGGVFACSAAQPPQPMSRCTSAVMTGLPLPESRPAAESSARCAIRPPQLRDWHPDLSFRRATHLQCTRGMPGGRLRASGQTACPHRTR